MLAVVAIAMSALPMSVAAQTGTRLSHAAGLSVGQFGQPDGPPLAQSTRASMVAARAMAACVIRQTPTPVGEYLRAPTTEARQRARRRLDTPLGDCMDSRNGISRFEATQLSMGASTFDGLLAEAWLRDHPEPPLAPIATPRREYAAAWVSVDPNQHVVDEMAACLAEMQPQRAAALIRSAADMPEERATFAALAPFIGQCLAAGATLKTNVTGARLAIATALYHRQYDQSGVAA